MLCTSGGPVVSHRTLANTGAPGCSRVVDDGLMTVPTPHEQLQAVRRRADRTLSLLLLLHFPTALALAVLHGTWAAAILVGGAVSGGAYLAAVRAPGAVWTRVLIVLGFVAYGGLLVDEAHGLIEMHFYFFASLAFLLVYRDWRLIVLAAGAIAVHHLGFMVLQDAGLAALGDASCPSEPRHGADPRGLRGLRERRPDRLGALDGGRDARLGPGSVRGRRRARAARAARRRAGAPRPQRHRRRGLRGARRSCGPASARSRRSSRRSRPPRWSSRRPRRRSRRPRPTPSARRTRSPTRSLGRFGDRAAGPARPAGR